MKTNPIRYTVFMAVILLASIATVPSQIIIHPNTIRGTLRFTNVNPSILSFLKAPGQEGMSNVVVVASSLPPASAFSGYSDILPVVNRTNAPYQITVESDTPGIAYSLGPYTVMEGQNYVYYFTNRSTAPVTPGVSPPPVDFDECVGVVTVQFVTPGGAAVAVDGGQIIAYDASTSAYTGIRSEMPAGITSQRIYLRGGMTHRMDITVHRGTNSYSDRIESFLSTNVLVTCDQFTTVRMVIPSPGLGKVIGTVDMLREFESFVAGNTILNYPDYTSVIAWNGPFSNQRWARLGGTNFTDPSSGGFVLTNVVPTTLDPSSVGYAVYAQMTFRTNRMIEYFRTPGLGDGSNPALVVNSGATVDLGDLFTIDPGYLRGQILLQGPDESLGRSSLFRGLLHSGDDTIDGIPSAFGTYGVYWSSVVAEGVDRLASGATLTASRGEGIADFDGSFNPVDSSYEGHYELALGGLKSENSIWKQDILGLTFYSGAVTNDDDYFDEEIGMADRRTNDVEIVPTQPATSDINYCFSEVKIVFRSDSGTFYEPQVRYSTGSFTGQDFQGNQVDYSVYLSVAAGTPVTSALASNIGQLIMYLPEGTYTLYPSIVPGSGTYALTGLQPIDITVGCGQRVALEPCLQLNLTAPDCANTPLAHITGSVRSCTNNVQSISYSLNGGPAQVICNNCGINPSFAFNLTLATECDNNSLTVTATDEFGGVSSVTTSIHYDVTPPVIECPTNIVASACDTNGAVVNFTVTATDNCSGPVTITATPPSGSTFRIGTTTVNCVATDGCGNTSQCSFTVTVGGSELSIERAVIVRWTCGGMLQSADDITGPWSDVPGATSPYCVAATAAHRFYRVRN